jgi:hypothetical protein
MKDPVDSRKRIVLYYAGCMFPRPKQERDVFESIMNYLPLV